MVEKSLEDSLKTSFHNSQSVIRSVVYKVVKQLVWDLLRKDVIGEAIHPHIANVSDTDAASEGLSKMLLTSSSVMPPIATFVRRKRFQKVKGTTVLPPCQRN